jgi:hypothetical protein
MPELPLDFLYPNVQALGSGLRSEKNSIQSRGGSLIGTAGHGPLCKENEVLLVHFCSDA